MLRIWVTSAMILAYVQYSGIGWNEINGSWASAAAFKFCKCDGTAALLEQIGDFFFFHNIEQNIFYSYSYCQNSCKIFLLSFFCPQSLFPSSYKATENAVLKWKV